MYTGGGMSVVCRSVWLQHHTPIGFVEEADQATSIVTVVQCDLSDVWDASRTAAKASSGALIVNTEQNASLYTVAIYKLGQRAKQRGNTVEVAPGSLPKTAVTVQRSVLDHHGTGADSVR